MNNYIATPLSREKIRALTLIIRKTLTLEKEICFPIVEMLEAMPDLFIENNFTFQVVSDVELPQSIQGDVDISNHYMRIKESVYDGACIGKGRDRFSIAHEIGHYILLNAAGISLQRNISNRKVEAFECPEWQADCFAGELLVPRHLVQGLDVNEIAKKCKVSLAAAHVQLQSSKNKRKW